MFVKSRSDWYSLNWTLEQNIIDTSANEWRKRLLACVRIVGQHFKQFYYRQLKNGQLDEMSTKVSEMWTKCVFTFYVTSAIISHWIKSDISLVVLSPGSAETNVGWGRKMNDRLMASCVRNIRTKHYQNLTTGFQVTVENVGDVFLRHSVWEHKRRKSKDQSLDYILLSTNETGAVLTRKQPSLYRYTSNTLHRMITQISRERKN